MRRTARSLHWPRFRSELGTLWGWGWVSILKMYNKMCTRWLRVFSGEHFELKILVYKSKSRIADESTIRSLKSVRVDLDAQMAVPVQTSSVYRQQPLLFLVRLRLRQTIQRQTPTLDRFWLSTQKTRTCLCLLFRDLQFADRFSEYLVDPLTLIWMENMIQIFISSSAKTLRLTDLVQFCGTIKSTFSVAIKSTIKWVE